MALKKEQQELSTTQSVVAFFVFFLLTSVVGFSLMTLFNWSLTWCNSEHLLAITEGSFVPTLRF